MTVKDKITTYYSNARELVRQNNPKAARAYVLAILNYALDSYNNASTIYLKAKTQAFLDKWIAVSRDLYNNGITSFVLKCFALPEKQEVEQSKSAEKPVRRQPVEPSAQVGVSIEPILRESEIDIAGLVEESAKMQGWCAELFEKNKTAVVGISVSDSGREASGTGFIISKNGYILTNDHVVYDEETQGYFPKVRMSFADNKKSYKLNVLFSDKKSDIALCSFNPEDVGEFGVISCVSDYSQLLQGADCLIIGNAFGMGLAPFAGVVRFTKNDSGDLVYTAPSNPGDSGGPVLNRQGECIGINKSKTLAVNNVTADGYANATPMDKINELLNKWIGQNDIRL